MRRPNGKTRLKKTGNSGKVFTNVFILYVGWREGLKRAGRAGELAIVRTVRPGKGQLFELTVVKKEWGPIITRRA